MQWYRNALAKIMNKEVDWDSDDLRVTLHTSTYAPDLGAHDYVNDLSNELATSGGYTSGGLAVASKSITYTEANSWTVQRANSTAYALGDVVRPASGNGFLYKCVAAGTSAGSIPTYPTTYGATVVDGGVTWAMFGRGIVVLSFTDPTWAAATFGPARYAVLSDRTPGTAATQPLLALTDFGSDRTGLGGAFDITMHAALRALHIPIQ